MPKVYLKLKIVIALLFISLQVYSQRPDFSIVGFATENGGTTGGAGGTVVTVSNYSDLRLYAEEANTSYIIQVSGTIVNGPDGGSVKVASNKTIVGIGTDAFLNGVGLTVSNGAHNVIIQNIKFSMMGVTTRVDKANVYSSTGDEGRPQILTNGGDCVRLSGQCNNVWIDHCEFFSENPSVQTNIDLYDGLLDITQQSGFVTVSWNYFHDHHKCNLVGSSETDLFADRKITFHHNYYRNIKSRFPLIRGAVCHSFNNYIYGASSGSESQVNACIRSEKNYFENSRNTVYSPNPPIAGFAEVIGNKEVSCTRTKPLPGTCTASIPYVYTNVLTNNVDSVKIIVPLFAGIGKLDGTCIPKITLSKTTSLCFGDSVTLTSVKGASYSWDDGITQVGTDSAYKVKTAGTYTVEVTDTLGCKAVSKEIPVTFASSITWYEDADGDGKGDPNVQQTICDQPAGYVIDNSDLCPLDAAKEAPGLCGCGNTEQSCVDCNGVALGSATLDACDRCIGGNTGKTACNAVGEAETDACSFNGVFENTNGGFKGTGYINTPNTSGTSITFSILALAAGNATLSFRYASGSINNRLAQFNINGIFYSILLGFPGTGTFTQYKTVEVEIPLVQGNNIVKLVASTSEGLANIDQIGYVTAGISKDVCVVSGVINSSEEKVVVYPNPFYEQISIEEEGYYTYRILSASGKELEQGSFNGDSSVGVGLQPGIYILEIQKDDKVKRVKIAKQ